MARLGDIELHVERESLKNDVGVPTHPVEDGAKLSDHVERLPKSLSLTGKVIRDSMGEAKSIIQAIRVMSYKGETATYTGRMVHHNMAVTNFTYEADANIANGFNFTATLQEIRIANQSYKTDSSSAKSSSTAGLQQTQNQQSGAKYHTIKKGETYWDLAPKYGTTWQQLEKLNGTDPKKLQVGQKIRVK